MFSEYIENDRKIRILPSIGTAGLTDLIKHSDGYLDLQTYEGPTSEVYTGLATEEYFLLLKEILRTVYTLRKLNLKSILR